ncbi:DUF624 domain-containing protein [Isoptericola sp. NEAU-Y5]|uniref:DUF624 domain-containing protein n=1 Tax=Isoptericola luteus TaxID=2879484 RepID=A0ABS7ZBS7_9MICO|nr:DUF624 domain-containing protein [Isoptericola sp. NEAU-Y5]MCA5892510.1 DUF624 domain-containing protein [Isoptericola sp. NEAU-Y5]
MTTDPSGPQVEDPRVAVRRGLADAEVPGWAGGVMAVLRWVTLLVEINVMVVLGTLAGGVLAGLGPALRAGSEAAAATTDGPTPWRTFWRTWRAELGRANLLFAPVWVVAALLWLDGVAVTLLSGPARSVLQVGLVVAMAWSAVALAYWPRVVGRYGDGAARTWRFLLLAPLLGPTTTLAVVVVLGATALAGAALPLVAVLAGVSFPLWATARLVDDRLDRIDARPA